MYKRLVVLFGLSLVLCLVAAAPAGAVVVAPGMVVPASGTPAPGFGAVLPAPGPTSGPPAATARTAAPASGYMPGELLVEFRATETQGALRAAVRTFGAAVVRDLPESGADPGCRLVLVRSATLTTKALAASLAHDPAVVRTCPNYVRRVDAAAPDDPGLIDQWGLFQVGAPQAWETTTGASDVVVADIDTGVDLQHPDLAANLWHNPGEIPGNGIDDDHNGYVDDVYGIDAVDHGVVPADDYGHGTHTAGIMAAVADNATGIAGVAPQTQVMALKFINAMGYGDDADAITCIDYVINEKLDHGVNVVAINASWGGLNRSPFLADAINRAGAAGIVFCASAGNDGLNNDRRPHYPSSYSCPNIIAVAATTSVDTLAGFSDWGARSVDLGAPGVSILSTLPTVVLPLADGETMYGSWSGTSMATPFVTGTVALLAAAHPGDTVSQRIARILSTVRRVPALRGKCVTGGRLDIAAALATGAASGDVTPPQTSVIGADDLWHDRPVDLRFSAVDEAGGSGVAHTTWRLDQSPWHRGVTAVVPAPPNTKIAHVVQFRSTDKAGNVEATKSCTVNIDTTQPANAEIPGAPLPASPFDVDLPHGKVDHAVYQVTLDAGQSLRVVATEVPGQTCSLRLYPPGTGGLGWVPRVAASWNGTAGTTLAYCAPQSGTYYLDVYKRGQPRTCGLTWAVYAAGIDVTPPLFRVVSGDSGVWFNRPVPLTVMADDGPLGSGVAGEESSTDGGLSWNSGAHATVAAPADHSNDGVHMVLFRASDVAGNVAPPSATFVAIDTTGPSTEAWGPSRAVRRGKLAWVRFRLRDQTWGVVSQLIVQSAASGKTVATEDLGWQFTGGSPATWGYFDAAPLLCTMARGTYRVLIAGTSHDEAGNLWQSAVCKRTLRVK